MKKILISILIIIIAIVLIFSLRNKKNIEMSPVQTNTKEFVSNEHNFTVRYPAELDVKEYTPNDITIGNIEGEMVDGLVDINVAVVEGMQGESPDGALTRYLNNQCAADGPTTSISCIGMKKSSTFTSLSGQGGQEIYLNAEILNIQSKIITRMEKGPYYVFPMSSSATMSKYLIISTPSNKFTNESDVSLVKEVAESLRTTGDNN